MRDAALALYAAREHRQRLNRIRLQKFIYLNDVVNVLFTALPKKVHHKTYRYGPYDSSIQAAMNCLIFRGFAIADRISGPHDGKTLYEFSLSKAGVSWVEELTSSNPNKQQLACNLAVAEQVNRYGWHRLKSLVYAEPTYVAMKQVGWGQELLADRAENNSTASLLAIMRKVLRAAEGKTISESLLLELFFRYLDSYDMLTQGLNPVEAND